MIRKFFVWLHRWVGLLMALFLVVVGLTGSILAFKTDFERLLTPDFFASPPTADAKPLDLATLAERAESEMPHARTGYFNLEQGRVGMHMVARRNPASGKPYDLGDDPLFLDPWTGKRLIHLHGGAYAEWRYKLIPFIYDLHTSMALGNIGSWTLGIVALAWTLDTFYAIYLTFPTVFSRFFRKWMPAWKIKWPSAPFRLNFDLHRASGLWFAPLLFIFAWSSVMFNLGPVYERVTSWIFEYDRMDLETILPTRQNDSPRLNWHEGLHKSEEAVQELAKQYGITIGEPFGFGYMAELGAYTYSVASNRNFGKATWPGQFGVWVDGDTGALQKAEVPGRGRTGNTISDYLYVLHFGDLHGWLVYRILVFTLGIIMTLLSVTGIYIWWKKRVGRKTQALRKPVLPLKEKAGHVT